MSRQNMFASVITWLRLKRYPRTDKGREAYIKNGFITPWFIELMFFIALSPIILTLWIYLAIKWILTGIGIAFCAFVEAMRELRERVRP